MSESPETSADRNTSRPRKPDVLVLVSWPKIVLLIPTLAVALLCGIIMSIYGMPESSEAPMGIHLWGILFLFVLAVNLTMVLYDLSLRGFFVVLLLIVVLVLGLLLLNRAEHAWTHLKNIFNVRVVANSAFYFMFSIILVFNLLIAWVITRFNYWKVEHNEIIINRGFMHEQERHPTAQARFKLVIEDVVEYAMLGCGKLVFTFADDGSVHELPTVLFVHRKAKKLDELLGRIEVISR
jgi:hypothetical protein